MTLDRPKWCGCGSCKAHRFIERFQARLVRAHRRARKGTAASRRLLRQRHLQGERALQRRIRVDPPAVQLDLQELGGNCPIQGTALLHRPDHPDAVAYFRARGNSWSVEVWEGRPEVPDDYPWPDWWHEEGYGTWPDAGWMPDATALELFHRAVLRWAAGARPT